MMEKKGKQIEKFFEKPAVQKRMGQYFKELEAWGESESVKAKKKHDEKIMNSKFGQGLWESIEKVGEDAQKVHWAAGFNQDGYGEWIKNEDAAMMFEDVYAVKEALKRLVESKMAAKNGELGMATFDDVHFKNMVEMMFKDLKVKSWDELKMKLMTMGMEIAEKMEHCEKMQKLFKHVKKLIKIAMKTQEIFDLPDQKAAEEWWNSHNFQPWM